MPTTQTRARRAKMVTHQNSRSDRTVATNLTADLYAKLDQLCAELDLSRSSLLRTLVEERINLEGHE